MISNQSDRFAKRDARALQATSPLAKESVTIDSAIASNVSLVSESLVNESTQADMVSVSSGLYVCDEFQLLVSPQPLSSTSLQSSEAHVINVQDAASSAKITSKDSDPLVKRETKTPQTTSLSAKACTAIDLASASNTSTVSESLVHESSQADMVSVSNGLYVCDQC